MTSNSEPFFPAEKLSRSELEWYPDTHTDEVKMLEMRKLIVPWLHHIRNLINNQTH